MKAIESVFRDRAFWVDLPGGWALNVSIHRWKDKDGGHWHVQAWHPFKRGAIISGRGIVR